MNQTFEDYDGAYGDIPHLSAEQILLAPYRTIQEAADDLLSNEELDESAANIRSSVLTLKARGVW